MSACDPHALTELFFDELAPQAAAALQRHAHACPACTQTLDGLRQDRERLSAPRGAMTSLEVLFRGVEARLAAAQLPPRRSPWQLLPGLVPFTGGCLAVLLALFAVGSGGLPPSSPEGSLAWGPSSARAAVALACPVDASAAEDDSWFDLGHREVQLSACLIASPGQPALPAEACF